MAAWPTGVLPATHKNGNSRAVMAAGGTREGSPLRYTHAIAGDQQQQQGSWNGTAGE